MSNNGSCRPVSSNLILINWNGHFSKGASLNINNRRHFTRDHLAIIPPYSFSLAIVIPLADGVPFELSVINKYTFQNSPRTLNSWYHSIACIYVIFSHSWTSYKTFNHADKAHPTYSFYISISNDHFTKNLQNHVKKKSSQKV